MRNACFDRSAADRRLGLRRAAIAAWAIVFVLFALVLITPGTSADRPPTPDRAIASLVAHTVPTADDACHCDDFDHLAMAPAPSLC